MVITYFASDTNNETKREDWNQSENRSPSKNPNQTVSLLPSKLPSRAHLPSCAGTHDFAQNFCLVIHLHLMFLMAFIFSFEYVRSFVVNGESDHPRLDIPGADYNQVNNKVDQFSNCRLCEFSFEL